MKPSLHNMAKKKNILNHALPISSDFDDTIFIKLGKTEAKITLRRGLPESGYSQIFYEKISYVPGTDIRKLLFRALSKLDVPLQLNLYTWHISTEDME